MRLLWLTDLHLDHAALAARGALYARLREIGPQRLLVSGDTGEADSVFGFLAELAREAGAPVDFVLGNHDFYGADIAGVRATARRLTRREGPLRWLPAMGVQTLAEGRALIGHDGWADGRLGDFLASPVVLNDHRRIHELSGLDRPTLLARVRDLGDEAAAYLEGELEPACRAFREILLLTHVPPFQAACYYQGRPSDDPDWLPHFVSKRTGEALLRVMGRHPACQLTVLCGHTHGGADVVVGPNLRVRVGEAQYGLPRVQAVWDY